MDFNAVHHQNEDPERYAKRNLWFRVKNILLLALGGWLIATAAAGLIVRALMIVTGVLLILNARWTNELLLGWRWPHRGLKKRLSDFYWKLDNSLWLPVVGIVTIVAGFMDGSLALGPVLTALSLLALIAVGPFVVILVAFFIASLK